MNDARVRDLEFRVKELQDQVKKLRQELDIVITVLSYHKLTQAPE